VIALTAVHLHVKSPLSQSKQLHLGCECALLGTTVRNTPSYSRAGPTQ
jgi:hypothetical protein